MYIEFSVFLDKRDGSNHNTFKMDSGSDKNYVCNIDSGLCLPVENDRKMTEIMTQEKDNNSIKLTYYFDPLCGWCYGFSPVIAQIQKEYGSKVDINVISGGLFLDQRAGKVNTVAPHIRSGAYKMVESRTGVRFGEIFLEDVFGEGSMTLNSLPMMMALCIVKDQVPSRAVEFAGTLLKAVYFDGINPIDLESYAPYIKDLGMDIDQFYSMMKEEKYRQAVNNDLRLFRQSPNAAMPALVLLQGNSEIPIARGYSDFQSIKKCLLICERAV